MHHHPLSETLGFGAQVELVPGELDDPAVAEALRKVWIDRGVLVFRGLPSNEATHLALGRVFGEVEVHPLRQDRGDPFPEIVDVVYGAADGDIYAFADGEQRGGWLPWHFDLCYSDRINHGGILRAVCLSASGSRTGFIDQIAAYAALPESLKARIDGLSVLYEMQFDASRMRFGRTPGLRLVRMQQRTRGYAERLDELPRAVHPMVYRQPETGRRVLHISPWFAAGIEAMEDAVGDGLLAEVIEHCTASPAYFHDWRPDDYVLWDNWRMMHCATGVPIDQTRVLQRVGIAGDYGFGRLEHAGAAREPAIIV